MLNSLYRSLRGLCVSAPLAERVELGGKKIIITGASPASIGFATAQILASRGASVVITARSNPEATAAVLNVALVKSGHRASITAHTLDLCQAQSVAKFVDWYVATHGEQLDVLINNAGVHLDLRSQWTAPQLSEDGVEIHWRTNYLGTFQLTQLLLPLLQKTARHTGDARVVNVVSMLHTKGKNEWLFQAPPVYNSWVAYGNSKLALVHHAFEIQRRYAASGLQAYCLHPGAVFTNIASKGLEGHRLINVVRNALAPVEAFFLLTPEEGAQTQVHCATSPSARGGLYYRQCRPAKPADDANDTSVSARLWEATANGQYGADGR